MQFVYSKSQIAQFVRAFVWESYYRGWLHVNIHSSSVNYVISVSFVSSLKKLSSILLVYTFQGLMGQDAKVIQVDGILTSIPIHSICHKGQKTGSC